MIFFKLDRLGTGLAEQNADNFPKKNSLAFGNQSLLALYCRLFQ
jgi:hypothetical protein